MFMFVRHALLGSLLGICSLWSAAGCAWYGLFVPAHTPRHLISTIHAAVVTVLNDNGVRKRLGDLGFIPGGNQNT